MMDMVFYWSNVIDHRCSRLFLCPWGGPGDQIFPLGGGLGSMQMEHGTALMSCRSVLRGVILDNRLQKQFRDISFVDFGLILPFIIFIFSVDCCSVGRAFLPHFLVVVLIVWLFK